MGALRQEQLGRRLLDLKEELESQRERRAELQGELRGIMARLEEEYGVKSLKEAEALLAEQQKKVKELEASLQDQMSQLEELMADDE